MKIFSWYAVIFNSKEEYWMHTFLYSNKVMRYIRNHYQGGLLKCNQPWYLQGGGIKLSAQ